MTTPQWERVDRFAAAPPGEDLIGVVEAVALDAARRFSADDRSRAVVVPVGSLPPKWVSNAQPPASAEIVFIDPPVASAALGLIAQHLTGQSVSIALPEGTDTAGLVEEPGRLSLPPGPGEATALGPFGLFRLPDSVQERRARLAGAPRVGESADVVDERSKWFEARQGDQG